MSRTFYRTSHISELVGRTIVCIVGMEQGSDVITFLCEGGYKFKMYHIQECCEQVSVDDVIGDVNDLLFSPIIVAEENTNMDLPKKDEFDDSFTWTFYKLATKNGYVDLRWYGASNGYYSESVDFEQEIYDNEQLLYAVMRSQIELEKASECIEDESKILRIASAQHTLALIERIIQSQ